MQGTQGANSSSKIQRVKQKFSEVTTPGEYRAAQRAAKRLHSKAQLEVLDAMFSAAERVGVDSVTGQPVAGRTIREVDGVRVEEVRT